MLSIDLDSAIFLYLGLLLGTALPAWILLGRTSPLKRRDTMMAREMGNQRQCGLCLHHYIDSNHSETSTCPQCGELNEY